MKKKFFIEQKKTAIEELCSIDLDAPTQLQTAELEGAVPLIAGVFFGKPRESIPNESGSHQIRYGLRLARVYVKTRDCRIDPQNRRRIVAYTEQSALNETSKADKTANAGAGLSVNLPQALRFFTFRFGAGGELGKMVSEEVSKNQERCLEVCSVWPAPSDCWQLVGISNQEGVLVGQVVGGDDDGKPLCHLIDVGPQTIVEALVKADLVDIWTETDVEGDSKEASANRRVVCAALIKRALGRRRIDADKGTGTVTLATARLVLTVADT